MASGDPVVLITEIIPPATLFAAPGIRAGGSTPAERTTVWLFDAATQEYLDFKCRLFNYGNGGLTFVIAWAGATATSGDCRWALAIRRINLSSEDIDTSQTYDYNVATTTAPGTSGQLVETTITFTNGSDMDSVTNNEWFILRLTREAANGGDTMTGDAQLFSIFGRET